MPTDSSDLHACALVTRNLIQETRKLADARNKLVLEYCASNRELVDKTRALIAETRALLRDIKLLPLG